MTCIFFVNPSSSVFDLALYIYLYSFLLLACVLCVCDIVAPGKYYSMWKVARTIVGTGIKECANDDDGTTSDSRPTTDVPTNAFQRTSLDGRTVPTIGARLLAYVSPMPSLFGAGALSSALGYGLTSILVRVRSYVVPNYEVATRPVPVCLAILYTGVYVAVISNLRYQFLQGIVEPYLIDGSFSLIEDDLARDDDDEAMGGNRRAKTNRRKMSIRLKSKLVLVRYANGVLGSWIAIRGMRILGLQKLK